MGEAFLVVVKVVAFVTTLAFAWPQVWRVRRGRPLTGISGASVLITFCAVSLWLSYGLYRGDPLVYGVNIPLMGAFAYMMFRALKAGLVDYRVALGAAAAVVAAVVAGGIGDPAITGAAAVTCGIVGNLPQLRMALRERDLSGLSWETYALAAAGSASWLIYGIAEGDFIIISQQLIALPVTMTIAIRTIASHRRLRAEGLPVEPELGGHIAHRIENIAEEFFEEITEP